MAKDTAPAGGHRKRNLAIAVGVIILIVAVAVGQEISDNRSVDMPEVTGMVASDARAQLEKAGFSKINFQSDSGKKVLKHGNWTVISQDPAAGTTCKAKTRLELTVRKTSEMQDEQVDAVVGRPAAEANGALADLGYAVSFEHASLGENYSAETLPDEIAWVISGVKTLDRKQMSVTLLVNTQENIDAEAAQKAMQERLSAKLQPSYAWQAAEAYGKTQFIYGFKLRSAIGKLAETAVDENTWYLKATCKVTNEYGVKAKNLTCEAKVTGTNENPQVVEFNVY